MSESPSQEILRHALRLHQAGRLPEAESLYRQVPSSHPQHADALRLLGLIARQRGQLDAAIDLFQKAIALKPNFPEAHDNLAKTFHEKGQLLESVLAYRQLIALKPDHAEAHNNLGNALSDLGQDDQAIAAYRQAILLNPQFAEAFANLANALNRQGNLDESIAAYRRAVALRPNLAAAHNNLGIVLKAKLQFQDAIAAYRQAISLKPNFAEAHNNLGTALATLGRLDDAIAAYQHAISLRPDYAEAFNNLANAFTNKAQFDQAITTCRQAIALRRNFPEAYVNLGIALRDNKMRDQAIAAFRQAISLDPSYFPALLYLGAALSDAGQPDEAVSAYRQAITLSPDFAEAHNNLGNALKDQRQMDQAIAAFRKAVALKPADADLHSNLVFNLHYHPSYDAPSIAAELAEWNRRHAQPLRKFILVHSNSPDPARPLRIGYVSPHFTNHVNGLIFLPILRQHDRHQFHITCYSHVTQPDETTAQIKQHVDQWRDIAALNDDQAAAQIHQDQIDILIDLTMHSADRRLLIFARKPAPVQANWLAYPGSSGLETIDYRLSDPHLDPPGLFDSIYSEKTVRLPTSYLCYPPPTAHAPAISPLPALTTGHITFASLNNFCKISDETLREWSLVMTATPNSTLLVLAPPGSARDDFLTKMQTNGISPPRIEFVPSQPRQRFLELFNRTDISLDTLPYNGHTTSLDSLWMGVPVITLHRLHSRRPRRLVPPLQSRPDRISRPFLRRIRPNRHQPRDRFAAAPGTKKQFAQRMEQSPLMDVPRFTRNLEATFRQMWKQWCER